MAETPNKAHRSILDSRLRGNDNKDDKHRRRPELLSKFSLNHRHIEPKPLLNEFENFDWKTTTNLNYHIRVQFVRCLTP